jgi:hypothetical protein
LFPLLLKITLITLLTGIVFTPILGVSLYYFTAILKPEAIWPDDFNSFRVNFFAAILTLIGILFHFNKLKINFKDRMFNKINILFLLIILLVNLSYLFSPFKNFAFSGRYISPEILIPIFNTMAFFYCISVFVINDIYKLKYVLSFFILATSILVLWSNNQFTYYGYAIFTDYGRMEGPNGQDENIFAARIIIVLPFYYYLFDCTKNKVIKIIMLLMIPLCWHAIYLTGSRGALVALIAITLLFAYQLNSKLLKLLLPLVFVAVLLTQSGQLLNRFSDAEPEIILLEKKGIDPRVESWEAGIEMALDNPLLGVGFERFQQATLFYGYPIPYVAHNTFLQISANSGLLAGIFFLVIIFISTKAFIVKKYNDKSNILHNIYNASALSLLSYFIISLFLNLLLYEMTFFLILINNLIINLINKENKFTHETKH